MYAGDYDDITALKTISDRFGIAVVVVHHVRKMKDANDPFNEVTGLNGHHGSRRHKLYFEAQSLK